MKPGGIPRRISSLQTGQAGNKTRLLIGRGRFLEIPFYYLFLTEHAKNHTLSFWEIHFPQPCSQVSNPQTVASTDDNWGIKNLQNQF